MKKIFLILPILFMAISCGNKEKFDEGIYCLDEYINKNQFESNYIETFLIRVSKDSITYFGTVNTWGSTFKRNLAQEKSEIVNDSTILQKVFIRKNVNQGKFIKLKNASEILDRNGINQDELSQYLNSKLIAGEYKHGKDKVIFTKDGKIKNLGDLKTFSVNPRFGTCWWYDYRTMKINNEIWKFDFIKDKLILTKYLKREVEEDAKLSNLRIVLER